MDRAVGGSAPPLVSLVLPTADRRRFVPQAVTYFRRQDYPRLELVVVDDGARPVDDLIGDDPRIRYLYLPAGRTLGAKRNLACEVARGTVIAHLDDDDWSAPWRIGYQVRQLLSSGAGACGLADPLFYEPRTHRAWRYRYPATEERPWACGATLCYTKAFWRQRPFPDVGVGEDTLFVWASSRDEILALADPGLFVGIIHDRNTSAKKTAGQRWQPVAAAEARALLSPDLGFYNRLAAAPPG